MTAGAQRSGWTVFSGILFFIAGSANIAFGLAALLKSTYFPSGSALADSLSSFGWVWLLGGILGLLLAFGIFMGRSWGRVGGIIVGVLMSIVWFFEMLYVPFLGMMMILLYVLVIYGLATRAEEFE